MDWHAALDMSLQYLKVLAWPLVVLVLALVYRGAVETLLQRLKKYSGWGQTVELGEEARELKHDSDAIAEIVTAETSAPVSVGDDRSVEPTGTPPAKEEGPATPSERASGGTAAQDAVRAVDSLNMFYRIANIDPRDFPTGARRAVSGAWRSLGDQVDELALLLNLPWNGTNLRDVAVALVNRGLLDKRSALIAFRLSDLHSELTRASDVDLNIQVIQDFIKSARNFQTILARVTNGVIKNEVAQGGTDD